MQGGSSTEARTIALIHTVTALVPVFDPLVVRELPQWKGYNVVDESLLRNTIRDGAPSTTTMRRLSQYIFSAVDAGVSAIVVTCSSLGGTVEAIRPFCPVPLFRIDEGMAIEAVTKARRIGVLATLPTTLKPTGDLIRTTAQSRDRECDVTEKLCEGAFARLSAGDREAHDALVLAGFDDLASKVDVVVLAQASMARSLSGRTATGVPVFSSPELGMRYVSAQLDVI